MVTEMGRDGERLDRDRELQLAFPALDLLANHHCCKLTLEVSHFGKRMGRVCCHLCCLDFPPKPSRWQPPTCRCTSLPVSPKEALLPNHSLQAQAGIRHQPYPLLSL